MARTKAKETKNGIRVSKKDQKRKQFEREHLRERRRVLISVLAVIAVACIGILYYLFGGASAKENTSFACGQQFSMIVRRWL